MTHLRILIADDHAVVREGLRALLEAEDGWTVVAEATNGRDAVKSALECRPHVAVLDFSMSDLNGIEAARQIRKDLPETEALILTMHDSEKLAQLALEAGARGYMLKSDASEQLVNAIKAVSRHQSYFTAKIQAMLVQGFLSPETLAKAKPGELEMKHLTPREREIVQLIAEGNTSKEIATQLHISERTVEVHRGNLFRKLGARSTVDLVRYAIRNHIIEP